MEHLQLCDEHQNPAVDTSRPFRSVKEAVAIFGERILVPEIHTPKPFTFPEKENPRVDVDPHSNYSSPRGPSFGGHDKLSDTVRKLEAELEDTKAELKLLKDRESETEVALASLNAELHKNMSELALAEAEVAKKAATGGGGGDGAVAIEKEEEKKPSDTAAHWRMAESSGTSPSLAQILSIGEKEGLFVGRKKERKLAAKKKPIIPLVGELFSSRKKGISSTATHNPLHASSHLHWN